jgi:hypothetical protein
MSPTSEKRRILHLLTPRAEALAAVTIRAHQMDPDLEVEVFDLRQAPTDYQQLLEKIFAADSVQVW